MMRTRHLIAAAGAVIVVPTVRAAARRRRAIDAVAADLRTRSLWLPMSVNNTLTLRIGRKLLTRFTEVVDGVTLTRRDTPSGSEVYVFEPDDREAPSAALLWIHGGGTIGGHPRVESDLCSRIAKDLGIIVVSARYRLAPEHPFPAGLDDAYAALSWLRQHAMNLGVDPDRVAVGGTSAGAGLAACVAQRAVDDGNTVAFQLLIYPMLDDRTATRDPQGRGQLGWTPTSNKFAWGAYLGQQPGGVSAPPYAVAARRGDLSSLPPAWIGIGGLDLFLDESVDYAQRLGSAGVDCELDVVPGMYHAADFHLASTVPSMAAFRERVVAALGRGLGTPVGRLPGPS